MSNSLSSVTEDKGCWESTSLTKKILIVVAALFAVGVTALVVIMVFKYQDPKGETYARPKEKITSVTVRQREHEIISTRIPDQPTTRQSFFQPDIPRPIDDKVCKTVECLEYTLLLMKAANFSVDPCDDFHEFVCGNFFKTVQIPNNVYDYGIDMELMLKRKQNLIASLESPIVEYQIGAIDNARAFYQGCISVDNTDVEIAAKHLKAMLMEMGGMPLLTDTNYNPKTNWQIRVADFTRLFSATVLIPVSTKFKNNKPTEKAIRFVDQTFETFLHDLKSKEGQKHWELYKGAIEKAVCLLKSGKCYSETEREMVKDEIQKLINFEIDLLKIQNSSPEDFYLYNVEDLRKEVPDLHLLSFLKALYKGSPEIELNVNTELYVNSLITLKRIVEFLDKADATTVANYIGVRFLFHIMPYCPQPFRGIKAKNDLNVGTTLKIPPIEEVCVDAAVTYFPQTVGRLFVEKHLHPDAKRDISHLQEQLKKTMDKLLQQNDWLDDMTKEAALRKLSNMKTYSAYPEWIFDNKTLNDKEGLRKPFDQKSVIRSIFALEKQRRKENLNLLLPVPEWHASPVIENDANINSANAIMSYAGHMQPPVYSPTIIQVFNYATIGFLIGHEITHGYDNKGAEYDYEGKFVNWWQGDTFKKFQEKARCFVEQYSKIRDKQTKLNLNGKKTLGENIADSGGLRLAYKTYMMSNPDDVRLIGLETYSHKQLFFWAYARQFCRKFRLQSLQNFINGGVHAPDKYRAYVPPSNYDKFSEAFNCPIGSAMNPAHKCVLW